MLVYRITLEKWSRELVASGRAARWNSNGHYVVYTAGSRALACLENVVHRRSIGRDEAFRVMVIEIPDDLKIEVIDQASLKTGWSDYTNYAYCQAKGDAWIQQGRSPVLRVPSAIIREEHNYLINPAHRDAARIRLVSVEDFRFDERLLGRGKG